MSAPRPSRLLSIGEFAAATQLTAKALRLYDEQDLLRPAATDAATGYRYYRSDQVVTGRLIRTLRAMDLPLVQIAELTAGAGTIAQTRLAELAQEIDRRYARQKRAFQETLLLLRRSERDPGPSVTQTGREPMTVTVWPFATDLAHFIVRSWKQLQHATRQLAALRLQAPGTAYCALLDPLTDEEGTVELLVPVVLPPTTLPAGITARPLPASRCATVTIRADMTSVLQLHATLDAMFDWFDRRGYRAVDTPLVKLDTQYAGSIEILWACESDPGVK
ncbi:MAG TPA: MerR family transcriptional regulator [Povalibacter sp.]|nr:MerR family transcriptional regulator [Povalibacter sp.]